MPKGNRKSQFRLNTSALCFCLGVMATVSILLPYIYIKDTGKETPFFRNVERLVDTIEKKTLRSGAARNIEIIAPEPVAPEPVVPEPVVPELEPIEILHPIATLDNPVADEIRTGMQRAFQAYMRDAWKADEYMPVHKRGTNTFGGKGLTIIDSLDTLHLMGLNDEFAHARAFVATDFHFGGHINVFENTIRVLGGLLSAYSLTRDELFLT
jgi:hypothetical protein